MNDSDWFKLGLGVGEVAWEIVKVGMQWRSASAERKAELAADVKSKFDACRIAMETFDSDIARNNEEADAIARAKQP